MDKVQLVAGNHRTVAADISLTSKVDLGESCVCICAEGMGPLTASGMIELNATGSIVANAGNATIEVGTDLTTKSNILIDGGLLGNVTMANSGPVGNAQTVELDSLKQSIDISNGNVPGTMQSISLCGLTQSIELSAGGLPISPTIQLSPTGIKLSCGPTNSIEITPLGIKISGAMVQIEGLTKTDVSGGLVNVQSNAITQIKGAMVMIN